MSRPRFLFVHGSSFEGVSRPRWPGQDAPERPGPHLDGAWTSWRLLAANNHELGRGAVTYPSDQECLTAVLAGRRGMPSAISLFVAHAGSWWWQLDVSGQPFAVSSRGYRRQREARYSLEQCLAEMESAVLPAVGERPVRGRRWSRSDPNPDFRLREAIP